MTQAALEGAQRCVGCRQTARWWTESRCGLSPRTHRMAAGSARPRRAMGGESYLSRADQEGFAEATVAKQVRRGPDLHAAERLPDAQVCLDVLLLGGGIRFRTVALLAEPASRRCGEVDAERSTAAYDGLICLSSCHLIESFP